MFIIEIIIARDYEELSKRAAEIIASEVQTNPRAVLGLATGETPLGTYRELVKIFNEGKLDFSRVITFNLDEYYGISSQHPQSYTYFMKKNLFQLINIAPQNTHIPDGTPLDVEAECKAYDAKLAFHGGIDLQLLGIGENGHIGFNEPAAELKVYTHLIKLKKETIRANSRFFTSKEKVPTHAITMGLGGILKAKRILLLASGKNKANVISKMLAGRLDTQVPASLLQVHPNVTLIIDKEIGNRSLPNPAND